MDRKSNQTEVVKYDELSSRAKRKWRRTSVLTRAASGECYDGSNNSCIYTRLPSRMNYYEKFMHRYIDIFNNHHREAFHDTIQSCFTPNAVTVIQFYGSQRFMTPLGMYNFVELCGHEDNINYGERFMSTVPDSCLQLGETRLKQNNEETVVMARLTVSGTLVERLPMTPVQYERWQRDREHFLQNEVNNVLIKADLYQRQSHFNHPNSRRQFRRFCEPIIEDNHVISKRLIPSLEEQEEIKNDWEMVGKARYMSTYFRLVCFTNQGDDQSKRDNIGDYARAFDVSSRMSEEDTVCGSLSGESESNNHIFYPIVQLPIHLKGMVIFYFNSIHTSLELQRVEFVLHDATRTRDK
eukprot:scaffold504_cov189-Ochromonas_danica.AAC.5